MNCSVLHKADTRGFANHGWLKSFHTFSFANYFNPNRMRFGTLRVLNDDTIAPGKGFDTHPHENMEIISIPLEGGLEHRDSMGNISIVPEGDIQVMSAGTGIMHSEYNMNNDKIGKFLQIWIYPITKNVKPRYDQITLDKKPNTLSQILSPNPEDEGVWIHQNAWFHLADFEPGANAFYKLKKSDNGVYFFLISGKASINGIELEKRDGVGIWNLETFDLNFVEKSELLIMDVPMNV